MKMKKSPVVLGIDLSSLFRGTVIAPIMEESFNAVEKDQRSWRFKIKMGSTDDIALAKEWTLFEMFIFGQAILGYFKGNVIGERIYWSFNETCGNTFVEYNFFDSLDEFTNLLQQRSKYYLDTLRLDEPDDTYILSLSKRLLDQISGGEGNILYLSAIGTYYFETSSIYEKLVREIMAKIYLVD